MKVIQIFRCFIFISLISNASGEYVPWMDVFKQVINNGLTFPVRLPPCNSQNCINGRCLLPMNECECFDGYEGIKCDRRKTSSFTPSLPPTTTPPLTTTLTTTIPFVIAKNITVTSKISPEIIWGTFEDREVIIPAKKFSNKTLSKTTVPPNFFESSTKAVTKDNISNDLEKTTVLPNVIDVSTTEVTVTPKINEAGDLLTTNVLPLNISTTVIPNIATTTSSLNLKHSLNSNFSTNFPTTTVIPILATTPLSTVLIVVNRTSIPDLTTTPTSNIITKVLKCPFANYCSKVAKNGICDLRCNIEECNFDNGDCNDKNVDNNDDTVADNNNDNEDDKCLATCIQQLKNGICNEECNIQSCNFDDCLQSLNPTISPVKEEEDDEKVKLKIIYETNPNSFDKTTAEKLLEKFSQLSNIPNIQFSTIDSGDYEIYKWTKDSGRGDRIKLDGLFSMLRQSNSEGVEVYFDVDFSQCKKSDASCRFENPKEVEAYINTAPVYKVTSELGAPVYEAQVIYPEKKNSNGIGYIIGMIFIGFVLVISVVGGLQNPNRKRKIIVEYPQPDDHQKDFPKRPRCDPQVFYEFYRRMRDGKTSETDLLQALETIYATYRSLEWRTERGETLLHWAIRLNHYDLARWMLDKIGDINAVDNGGSTYLFDSIKNTDASFEIFKRLLEIPSIEVNKYTDAWPNLTPLKQCAESDGLLRFLNLLCKHPRINIRSIGFTKDRKCKRQNVLHHAAGYGSVETIKYLLQLNVTKKKSETNLIAVLDDNGRTPLVYALESEQWEAAKLLIQHMKTVDLKAGIPALTVAKHCGNEEIYQLIDAKIPKETPPPPPPKKAEPVKSSALEYMKSTVCNFGLLPPPASTIMPPPQTYGNQQYYQNQSPPMMLTQQQPSPVIVQQPQPLPPQMQYPQPQVQLPNSQASSIISPQQRQPPPMIATQPQQQQQLPPPVQHPQQQIQIPASAQPMVQYTPPSTAIPTTATLPQYVQQQQYFVNMEVSTSSARQQQRSQLSRMLSQPVIAQVPQQQRQQQLQYQNQYASMQSIPSSSTGHFVAPQMPQQRIPQQQQQQHPLQQQWQQNTTEYSQPITAPSNYTNYPQFNNFVVPVERRQPQPLKRAQSHAVLSTIPQYYQEVQPQQLQQQYYPPNNAVTNYSNYQQISTMSPHQQQQHPQPQNQQLQQSIHQPAYHYQPQQQIQPVYYHHQQQPQTSTPNPHQHQQPQQAVISNYQETAVDPTTLMLQPNLSPITSDESGYHTNSPESFLNYTNDSSFQNTNVQ